MKVFFEIFLVEGYTDKTVMNCLVDTASRIIAARLVNPTCELSTVSLLK